MKKLALILFISALAVGCEKNEPEPEPPLLTTHQLERKEQIESVLEDYSDVMTDFIVKQQHNEPTFLTKLHAVRDEQQSFEIVCDDFGITAHVTTVSNGKSAQEEYFYSHVNLRGYNFSYNFTTEPYYAKLSLLLTEEYNWKD